MNEEVNPIDFEGMSEDQQMPNPDVEFAETMIVDERIPRIASRDFWGYLNKDTILGRTGKSEKWDFQNNFVIQRNFDVMSKPAFEVDINEIKQYENIRNRFTTQVNRSIDGFERDRLAMQIKEVRTNRPTHEQSTGLWPGIKKKFGFGVKRQMEAEHGSNTY